jgi:hypothetical protein
VKAVLRGTHSPDILDLPTYKPENPDSFGFLLQLFIGPEDGDGYESFDVMICTPQWLSEQHGKEDIVIGRHHMIVFEYNYQRIIQRIDRYIQSCTGETWQEVAQKVGWLGQWEFENYSA